MELGLPEEVFLRTSHLPSGKAMEIYKLHVLKNVFHSYFKLLLLQVNWEKIIDRCEDFDVSNAVVLT